VSQQRVVYRIAAEDEERLVARLWQYGTLGVETRDAGGGAVLVEAYFAGEPPPAAMTAGASVTESGPAAATDWLAVWREAARPVEVGERFLLDPRETDQPDPESAGRILLRVPARAAFGTGSHESTRLVLELMETTDFAGRRVLDVGTGTAVLAMAALALGAGEAVGCDVDLVAPILATQNARLNRLRPRLFAGGLAALSHDARFDVALVNVIPEEIRDELPALRAALATPALAIFSGILAERGEAALVALASAGFHALESRASGEWIAYRCEAAAA
jgi:ribosomal protein L11 methyltransferase